MAPKMNEALSPLLIVNLALTSNIIVDFASRRTSSLPTHWAPSHAPIFPFIRPVANFPVSEVVDTPRLSTADTRQ